MRALIWADLHGHNYKEFSTVEDGMNTRLKDCADVIGKILLSAKEEKVNEVWFVGDLFQLKNNLDNKVIQIIMSEMEELADNFPVFIVPGNHDYRAWSSEPILLEILNEMPGKFVLFGNEFHESVRRNGIHVEPFTRKTKELNERIAKLETNPEQDIFFGHQDIIGQRYGGFVVEHGLDANVLSKKFKWSFIGHWHQPDMIRENVVSVGAPLQHNFGDVRTEWDKANRGWWILDTEKEHQLKFVPNISSPEFVDYIWDPNAKEKEILGNWGRDFYRLKVIGHAELPERLKRIKWKRVSYEIKGQVKKRTSISFSDKKEDIIEKYVVLRGGNLDHKKLIEMGRRYL
jgi:DNA repair exonuclease SbcCD nuclease subunit